MAEFANNEIEGIKELNKQLGLLKKELKEVTKVAADTVKSINVDKAKSEEIQKLTKAQQTLVTTSKELSKIEKQEADLIAKINVLRHGEQDEILKLKAEQQDLLKQKKLEAKENAGLLTAYQKQSKRLRELKNEYKDLAIGGKENTKQAKKLHKEIGKLDKELRELDKSVGDSYREIGKYEDAIKDAIKEQKKQILSIGGLVAAFQGLGSAMSANEESSEAVAKMSNRFDAVMNVTKNTVANFANDLVDFTSAVWNNEKSITEIGSSFEDTGKAISNYTKNVKEQIKASDSATVSNFALEKAVRPLKIEIEELNGEIEKQNSIAGDTTKGMDSIAASTLKALAAEKLRNEILVNIGQKELDIINDKIAATTEDSQRRELLNEQNEKEVELISLKNELLVSTLELGKQARENERDQYEKALDYALDLFDTQKTLNERQIADETKTFTERANLLNRTKELADKAFQEQIKLSEDYTEESLKLNELVAIDDEKIIYDRINALTQDEIVQQRLLDIIRDRKTAILDLADAEKELQQAIKERGEEDAAKNAEEAKDLEDARNALTQFRLDQKKGVDNEIKAAEFRAGILLNNEELLADERILIEEQLQAEIKAIKDKALEEELERIQKQKDEAFKFAKDLTGFLGEEIAERNAQRIEGYDKEIELAEETLEKQKENAIDGKDADIANEKKRLDALNLERKEALKKQQQQEEAIKLAEAFIDAYQARLNQPNADPNQALGLATKDVFLARGIAKTLAAGFAYDGVEDTGAGAGMDEKNGKLWMLHPNERVMSKKQNQLVGDLSNDELANLAYSYRIGVPINKEEITSVNNNAVVVNELKNLNETIKSKPVQQIDIDKLGNIIEIVESKGFKTMTKLKTRSRL